MASQFHLKVLKLTAHLVYRCKVVRAHIRSTYINQDLTVLKYPTLQCSNKFKSYKNSFRNTSSIILNIHEVKVSMSNVTSLINI